MSFDRSARRRLIVAGVAAAGLPSMALTQAPSRTRRVGYLSMASPDGDRQWVAGLLQGLRDLGYVEGRNLVLEQRHAFNDAGRIPDLAADLVRHEVEIFVAYGMPAVQAARKTNLPVVMTVHADPVGTGVVNSLARPGGNITGLTDGHTELAPKRLEILKDVVPSVSKVAVMFNPENPSTARQWRLVQPAAPRLRMTVVPVEVHGARDIERAFSTITKERSDAVFLSPDPSWWVGNEKRIANLTIENRLPSIGTVREFAEHGLLIAYGTNFAELWRRSAAYVDKILKGAKPGELAIEHPTKFDLVLNIKTARAIGVTVPRGVMLRADHVID